MSEVRNGKVGAQVRRTKQRVSASLPWIRATMKTAALSTGCENSDKMLRSNVIFFHVSAFWMVWFELSSNFWTISGCLRCRTSLHSPQLDRSINILPNSASFFSVLIFPSPQDHAAALSPSVPCSAFNRPTIWSCIQISVPVQPSATQLNIKRSNELPALAVEPHRDRTSGHFDCPGPREKISSCCFDSSKTKAALSERTGMTIWPH